MHETDCMLNRGRPTNKAFHLQRFYGSSLLKFEHLCIAVKGCMTFGLESTFEITIPQKYVQFSKPVHEAPSVGILIHHLCLVFADCPSLPWPSQCLLCPRPSPDHWYPRYVWSWCYCQGKTSVSVCAYTCLWVHKCQSIGLWLCVVICF